jgi:hypothetical protein
MSNETSNDPNTPAVKGVNTGAGGIGVFGFCETGHGVHGESTSSRGVFGDSKSFHGVYGHSVSQPGVAGDSDTFHAVYGTAHVVNTAGVYGTSKSPTGGVGVKGVDEGEGGFGVHGVSKSGNGVHGESTSSRGVFGDSHSFHGVFGHSVSYPGVAGDSDTFHAVYGTAHDVNSAGVYGTSKAPTGGFGVIGDCVNGNGVRGNSQNSDGIHGYSKIKAGVVGESEQFDGVYGISHAKDHAGVTGYNPGGMAGFFDGDVVVTGDITLSNADCAEDFDIGAGSLVEPGTVMTLGKDGALFPAGQAYDKCVAGVVSGAGDLKPGIVLDKQSSNRTRQPIALLGKVYCKVDALYGSIEIGDLLTTSQTAGHAMKAQDRAKAFGSVIGKALRPFPEGRGLIPILIALQ